MRREQTAEAGFSLLEALIALSILALAAGALVGAAQAHVDRVRGLEGRVVASWVAANCLTVLRVSWGSSGACPAIQDMAGQKWRVAFRQSKTTDPEILRIDVRVARENEPDSVVTMIGFVDNGATP